MATIYSYRCADCGAEIDQPWEGSLPPESFDDAEGHPAGNESRVLCHGRVKRIWGNSRLNLGYQPLKHNSSQHWLFKHG